MMGIITARVSQFPFIFNKKNDSISRIHKQETSVSSEGASGAATVRLLLVSFFQHGSLVLGGEGGELNPPQRATRRAAHGQRGARALGGHIITKRKE